MSSPAPATTTAAPPDTGPAGFTHRQILAILSGLLLGMFLAALDQNIVATSIRTIADDLNGLELQAWATTAYLLTATISTPLYGKLSDLYGRKPFFLAAIGIFVVGSLLCTISTSMYELAAFRAIQGLGAGGLMSLALTIIGDIVPPRERARYQGFFLAVFGTSSVLGPVVGGFLAGTDEIIGITGWRWVFLVNVPVGIVALVVVSRVLNLPHTRREHRIDAPGALALALTLVPILLVAEQGRDWGWGSPGAITCYVLAVVGLVAFLLAERHYGDDAVLPLRLFRNSVFSVTSVIAIITGVGLFGGIALVPQYLQIVTGSTPTEAGLEMLPLVGGLMVSSIIAGQLTSRTGRYKVFPVVGLGLMTVGLVLFHFLLHVDTSYGEIAGLMVVFGLGVGLCMQTLVLAVQNAVPAKDMGVATASATFFRQMGGTLGVAVFLSILFSTVGDNIRSAFATALGNPSFLAAASDPAVAANPANAVALNPAAGASQVVTDSSVLGRMDPRLAQPFLRGFADSMDTVFLVAACVVAVGFVLIWFMKEVPLRTQSGIQARDAEGRPAADPPAPGSPEGSALDAVTNAAPVPVPAAPDAVDDPDTTDPDTTGTPVPAAQAAGPAHTPLVRSTPLPGRIEAEGGPVGGVEVTLHDLGGTILDRVRSRPDGTFDLRRGADGSAVLIVSAAGHRPVARLVRLPGSGEPEVVVLQPAGEISGRVCTDDGAPVAGATVTVTDAAGAVAAVVVTGSDGAWRAGDLERGEHTVSVLAPDRGPVATTVDVRGAVTHETVLPGVRHTVSGRVCAESGGSLGQARVVLVGDDGAVRGSTTTDASGAFRLDGVRDGRYRITASGFAPVTREVRVDGGHSSGAFDVVVPAGPASAGLSGYDGYRATDGHGSRATDGHGSDGHGSDGHGSDGHGSDGHGLDGSDGHRGTDGHDGSNGHRATPGPAEWGHVAAGYHAAPTNGHDGRGRHEAHGHVTEPVAPR